MNILSIGNSFSNNAHRYLPQIAKADGEEILLCNLSIGGCSLEKHFKNWREEKENYNFEVYLPNETEMRAPDGLALHDVVEDEDWDVITLQQCSHLSGIRETYTPYLAELAAYCKMVKPDARIMLHQTWAYSKNCLKPEFAQYYHNSQDEMYSALTECYADAAKEAEIDIIIPSGRAFQTARQTIIGDRITTADGYHANELGCFLAGACFYEKIFNKSILENKFILPDFDENINGLLKACAHIAVEEGILK